MNFFKSFLILPMLLLTAAFSKNGMWFEITIGRLGQVLGPPFHRDRGLGRLPLDVVALEAFVNLALVAD